MLIHVHSLSFSGKLISYGWLRFKLTMSPGRAEERLTPCHLSFRTVSFVRQTLNSVRAPALPAWFASTNNAGKEEKPYKSAWIKKVKDNE